MIGPRSGGGHHPIHVVVLVVATLACGIPFDALGPPWGQAAVVAWTWAVLAWIAAGSDTRHRRELGVCLVMATLGELFLMEGWGLYHYRLGNLPLFIPPGHAIVFAASVRMSRVAPRWLPVAVTVPVGLYLVVAGWLGVDTQGLLWFLVFLGYLAWSGDRGLCAVLFVFALAIESYGTALGGWRYHPREPWFGLTTTNPPIWIGAVYCTLETLVRGVASRLPLPSAQAAAFAASRASRRYNHATTTTIAARSASVAANSAPSVQSHWSSPARH